MSAYYNEIDPFAAQWLRNLISAGHIASGDVDERSILDVRADDLKHYTQCHFFAGIGVWSHALRLAGWADDRPVWTGSCPCQPFSAAGKQKGTEDERHLWPVWFDLIRAVQPPTIFGEQVAAAVGHSWLDTVQADLEAQGYSTWAVVLGAHSVGAPHIRQRLWFVADAECGTTKRHGHEVDAAPGGMPSSTREQRFRPDAGDGFNLSWMADNAFVGRDKARASVTAQECDGATGNSTTSRMDNPSSIGRGARRDDDAQHDGQQLDAAIDADWPSPTNGYWRDADWLFCRDGKWRPVESTTERMADGIADSLGFVRTGEGTYGLSPLKQGAKSRVGRLRAYGNAIVPQVAAEVIAAFMECRP